MSGCLPHACVGVKKDSQTGQKKQGMRLEEQSEGKMCWKQHQDTIRRKRRKCFDHNILMLKLCLNLISWNTLVVFKIRVSDRLL